MASDSRKPETKKGIEQMNQTQAAAELSSRINAITGWSAKVKFAKDGTVRIDVTKDSGGKKGWISAGLITVGEAIEFSKETEYAFTAWKDEFAVVSAPIEYVFEPIKIEAKDSRREELIAAAKAFRSGIVIDEDLVVACVVEGLLSQSEAMNRDW